jgi:MerR family transcriptional regulator, light-induced transcriptional regulator
LHFDRNPGLLKRYGSAGKERCHEDAVFHLDFLTEALKMEHRGMYANYILWAAAMLENRNVTKSDLLDNLEYILQAFKKILGENAAAAIEPYIAHAKEELQKKAVEPDTYITDDNPLKDEVSRYLKLRLTEKKLNSLQEEELNKVFLNDFSHLNNELINKQRELLQKNAKILQLNKKLEKAN